MIGPLGWISQLAHCGAGTGPMAVIALIYSILLSNSPFIQSFLMPMFLKFG